MAQKLLGMEITGEIALQRVAIANQGQVWNGRRVFETWPHEPEG
jgi:hypothetical protein